MSESKELPIIFLAFANDYSTHRTRFLRELRTEIRQLQSCLEDAQSRGLCKLILRTNATVEDILQAAWLRFWLSIKVCGWFFSMVVRQASR